MVDYNLFSDTLCLPGEAITYEMSRRLAERFPDLAIVEGSDCLFDVPDYAKAGHCTITESTTVHNQVDTSYSSDDGLSQSPLNAWLEVEWRGHSIEVVTLRLNNGRSYWVMARTKFLAERFLAEVCEWNTEVRDEVLVFDGGYWDKDPALRRAIEGATFENLILKDPLKSEIRSDLDRFFAARPTYEKYGIPWKRGLVFIGPPGNGKTHAVKALINATGKPCLYIKSFQSCCETEHDAIRKIFDRARRSAPCILVFEDLDSLIHDKNRAFFLNELDGFASNTGVVTVATTNHPDRLDPAILDRPSRFDRKFHFDLPGPDERRAYLAHWNGSLEPSLQLAEEDVEAVVGLTDGYSFAYLKELFVSSLVAWIDKGDGATLGSVVASLAPRLRAEMVSAPAVDS
jgi:hypothetical protein